jgi:hypothetical protein
MMKIKFGKLFKLYKILLKIGLDFKQVAITVALWVQVLLLILHVNLFFYLREGSTILLIYDVFLRTYRFFRLYTNS